MGLAILSLRERNEAALHQLKCFLIFYVAWVGVYLRDIVTQCYSRSEENGLLLRWMCSIGQLEGKKNYAKGTDRGKKMCGLVLALLNCLFTVVVFAAQ